MRGDIHTPFAGRAKEYAWSLCLENAPRAITPTDVDYMVEASGYFLFFEMKTIGAPIPKGQRIALERLLSALLGKAVLLVVSHVPLERVELPGGVVSVDLWVASGKGIRRFEGLAGSAFIPLYEAFFRWASGEKGAFRRALIAAKEAA